MHSPVIEDIIMGRDTICGIATWSIGKEIGDERIWGGSAICAIPELPTSVADPFVQTIV
jgi:hypothetical protein